MPQRVEGAVSPHRLPRVYHGAGKLDCPAKQQSGSDVHRLEEVLFEFHRIGNAVRVSAIDPVTGTEVTIQGPASAGETTLHRTAVTKLRYVLSKTVQQN